MLIAAAPLVAQAETSIRVTLQLPRPISSAKLVRFSKDHRREIRWRTDHAVVPMAQLFKDKEVPEAVGSGAVEADSALAVSRARSLL